jgi:hypothetical protein
MDRLVEAAAEYLCRHRSVGLFRLTLDLTRRRLDIFAEVGAVEVVKGAVSPPTPGTDAWRWATGRTRPADKPDAKSPTAKNGTPFPPLPLFRFRETPKNGVSILPNSV